MSADDHPPTRPGDATQPIPPQRSGERIGQYRLLEKIGEGGMGEVHLAEQEEPVRRRVALKVIKHGMDTKEVVARFEAERQALAMMDHPCIARVYDAGQTPRGRPYFVMEYVPGIPITEYCDRHRLSMRDRLELVLAVCAGVQHAHQKAIIHRDLKPSNVLVTVQDEKASPKIIDFGVAKAIHQRLTEHTMFTELGQLIGTPEYMSPEQAEGSELNVDIRTDVYSLGVILYELLTGSLPFEARELRSAGYAEIQRILREVEPPRPSTRVTKTEPEQGSRIAQLRRTEPRRLAKQLQGDLDWIILRALEKDRTRRYATVNDLAQDLGRHLSDQPVLAGPPSLSYRMGKFARRNRAALFAGGAIALGVLVAAISLGFALIESNQQRSRIAAALAETEQARDESEAVTGFLVDMLAAADPGEEGRDVLVRELLDMAAWSVTSEFGDRPEVQARLRGTLGVTYTALGRYEEAEGQLASALSSCEQRLGPEHPQTLDTMVRLAALRRQQGEYAAAESLATLAFERRREILGSSHPATINAMNNLVAIHSDAGNYAQAESLGLRALELRRGNSEDRVGLAGALEGLASIYHYQGRFDEAEPLYHQSLDLYAGSLGDDHPQTLITRSNIGALYSEQSRFAQAESVMVETLDAHRRVVGNEHPRTLANMNGLGIVYDNMGRFAQAESLYVESLALKRKLLGTDHPATLSSMNNIAVLYWKQGRHEDAGPVFEAVIEVGRRVLGPEHPRVLSTMGNLAFVHAKAGRYAEAESLYGKALEGQREILGNEHPNVLVTKANLGVLWTDMGQHERAEELLGEALRGARQALPPDHWITGVILRDHGKCLTGLGRFDEAERELLDAHERLASALGPDHARTQLAVDGLVELYRAWGREGETKN